MPFGAEIQPDGAVRFRLWAPNAREVRLCLQDSAGERRLPMERTEDGWHEQRTVDAGAGTLYRYQIDGGMQVPDPASRFQPRDVHGPSQVIDPKAFSWDDAHWRGRPWEETVIYELHVGTFSPQGTFAAAKEHLDYLVELGVTALELMPVADFPGHRNWGYDGVAMFAPDARYGRPEDLKELIQTAHAKGLMVFLDVVYNHFGPEGNYLHIYAPDFFRHGRETPWGAAINFDGGNARPVRGFFIHNALYWLKEYHVDGLRLDAVHAIVDNSRPDILEELADAVHSGPGRDRPVHLVLENDHNAVRHLERTVDGSPRHYVAQWNDDLHHALHVLTTGEQDGYYQDFTDRPAWYLGRALTEGFAYQGEPSAYRHGACRGAPSAHLPSTAFVSFLQSHDQVGNRPFGQRIDALTQPQALQAALAIVLLAPSPPLLFMGQEFCANSPFLFFCEFGDDLADAVSRGRRREFARFARFADSGTQQTIPDPNAVATFERSKLRWDGMFDPDQQSWLTLHRQLLHLRRREIVPRLRNLAGHETSFEALGDSGLLCQWRLGDDSRLTLLGNLGDFPLPLHRPSYPMGAPLYATPTELYAGLTAPRLPPWSVAWYIEPGGEQP